MRHFFSTFLWSVLLAIAACAQDVEPTPAVRTPQTKPAATPAPDTADRTKQAIIISGIGGEAAYSEQFAKWAGELRRALVERLDFADDQVRLLLEKPEKEGLRASAEEVRRAFESLRAGSKDQTVYIFFIGHGSYDGKQAKFNLIGPDLSVADYAALIKSIPAKSVVIVNMASASGEFIKPLSGAGRVVITATRSGQEQNATRFPEYFIGGLTSPEADADKNRRISLLEAFNYATKLTGAWYEGEGRLATEHALIDDNGDGVGHQKAEGNDGALAKTTYLDSLPRHQAGGDATLAKMFEEKNRLEGEIELLKARKDQMKPEEYEAQLEKLLLELARVSQAIKSQKN